MSREAKLCSANNSQVMDWQINSIALSGTRPVKKWADPKKVSSTTSRNLLTK